MTLNDVTALILRYFTEFSSFRGALHKTVGVIRCRRKKFTFAISSPDELLVRIFTMFGMHAMLHLRLLVRSKRKGRGLSLVSSIIKSHSDVISLYHIYHSCFSAMIWGKLKPTDSVSFEQRDISPPFNFTQCAVFLHNIEIVLWPQIAVTSPHPMYSTYKTTFHTQGEVTSHICGRNAIAIL